MTNDLKITCKTARVNILKAASFSKEGHIGSSFSVVEILITLFEHHKQDLNGFLRNFNLSKGHAVFALYAAMKEYGILSEEMFQTIGDPGSKLIGHVPQIRELGLRYGTGSLGHGLPFAVGQALSDKLIGSNNRRFVIVGDGEMNEGSIWEAINIIQKFKPLNLDIVVDYNSSTERAIPSTNFRATFESLDHFIEVDGHYLESLLEIWRAGSAVSGVRIIWANTIKGYGISEMHNNPAWHHRIPSGELLLKFIEEIEKK
jgi:transketolase